MVSLQVFNKVCVVLMAARQQAKLIDGNRGGKVLQKATSTKRTRHVETKFIGGAGYPIAEQAL